MDASEPTQDQGREDVAVDLLGDQRKDPDEDRQRIAGSRLGQRQYHRQRAPDQWAEERHRLQEEGDDAPTSSAIRKPRSQRPAVATTPMNTLVMSWPRT